jgi:hypothetical protein
MAHGKADGIIGRGLRLTAHHAGTVNGGSDHYMVRPYGLEYKLQEGSIVTSQGQLPLPQLLPLLFIYRATLTCTSRATRSTASQGPCHPWCTRPHSRWGGWV